MTQIGFFKIEIPGGQMYTEAECEANKKLYEHNSMWVEEKIMKYNKEKRKKFFTTNKERINFVTRGCIPATQVIAIYDEVYNYYISNECPDFSSPNHWKRMNPLQKLEAHLNRTAESLGGKLISYEINPD